tara:strand:+ start:330 stop:527 length:198 start_codon:yes stop_codon:yes gene_type:complete
MDNYVKFENGDKKKKKKRSRSYFGCFKRENMEKETKGMTKEEKFYYKTGIIYSGSETSSVILSAI